MDQVRNDFHEDNYYPPSIISHNAAQLLATCALQVSGLEAKLKEKCTVDYQVKIFPGQNHGFAHRKREDISPEDEPRIQEARTDMINWLNKYI